MISNGLPGRRNKLQSLLSVMHSSKVNSINTPKITTESSLDSSTQQSLLKKILSNHPKTVTPKRTESTEPGHILYPKGFLHKQNTYFTVLQKGVQKRPKLILPRSLHVTFDSSHEDATFGLECTTIFLKRVIPQPSTRQAFIPLLQFSIMSLQTAVLSKIF